MKRFAVLYFRHWAHPQNKELEQAMETHILEKAVLTGTYQHHF